MSQGEREREREREVFSDRLRDTPDNIFFLIDSLQQSMVETRRRHLVKRWRDDSFKSDQLPDRSRNIDARHVQLNGC